MKSPQLKVFSLNFFDSTRLQSYHGGGVGAEIKFSPTQEEIRGTDELLSFVKSRCTEANRDCEWLIKGKLFLFY